MPIRIAAACAAALALAASSTATSQNSASFTPSRAENGYYNGVEPACNLAKSEGHWHVLSTVFAPPSLIHRGFPNRTSNLQWIHDPGQSVPINLAEVAGLEMMPSRLTEAKIPQYRGVWPITKNNFAYFGQDPGDRVMIGLDSDFDVTSLFVSFPDDKALTGQKFSVDTSGRSDPVTTKPYSENPTLIVLRLAGQATIMLEAQSWRVEVADTQIIDGMRVGKGGTTLPRKHYVASLPTFKMSLKEITAAIRAQRPYDAAYSEEFARLANYLDRSTGAADGRMRVWVVEDGAIVFDQTLEGLAQALPLLSEGANHSVKHVLDPICGLRD
ncbi:MAG: hypothetical protein AAGH57_09195 [Pseudomonadota bacterium]